jgi:hypothetical protein
MPEPLDVIDFLLRSPQGGLRRTRYRPLVIGPAWLGRRTLDGRWLVPVSTDGRLRPLAARPRRHDGCRALLTWALLTPEDADLGLRWRRRSRDRSGRRRHDGELLGWCLLYQPRGIHGWALVDAGPPESGLPATFELPGELFDRVAFLAARGIRSRPLALVRGLPRS